MNRKITRKVSVGGVVIGGGEPIAIQSMLCKPATELKANIEQAKALEEAGCQILRIAIPTEMSAQTLSIIKNSIKIPIVADIHFNYKLALLALEAGADKIRINPGNIGGPDKVAAVAEACKKHGAAIRVGVNSGSLEKDLLKKYGGPTPEAMIESTERHVRMLEALNFHDIVIALKSPYVKTVIEAYRLASERFDYPLHLGVTESGTRRFGTVKSAIAIGALIADGIGDTLRVSLCDDPVEEIYAAKMILKASGLPGYGPTVIACPTCGRTKVDVMGMAEEMEKRLSYIDADITVAVMGCIVNGPGEASQADYGMAGGDGKGVLFSHGKVISTCAESELIDKLMDLINSDLSSLK